MCARCAVRFHIKINMTVYYITYIKYIHVGVCDNFSLTEIRHASQESTMLCRWTIRCNYRHNTTMPGQGRPKKDSSKAGKPAPTKKRVRSKKERRALREAKAAASKIAEQMMDDGTVATEHETDEEDETDDEAEGVDDCESDDEDFQPPEPKRQEDRKEMGLLWANQEEIRTFIKVCYIYEFKEPPEEDWVPIISIIHDVS